MVNKTFFLILLCLLVLTSVALTAPVARQTPSVRDAAIIRQPEVGKKNIVITVPRLTLVAPRAGEEFSAASAFAVKWTYSGAVGTTVKIELLKGGGYLQDIAAGAPVGANGTGICNWPLPNNLVTGSDYQIRITSLNDARCTSICDKFSIHNNSDRIRLTSPGAGTWANGAKLIVNWELSNNVTGAVTLYLVKDNQRLNEIGHANTAGGRGSFIWTVPADLAGGDYQIRAVADAWQGLNDISPRFTVKAGAPVEMPGSLSKKDKPGVGVKDGKSARSLGQQTLDSTQTGLASVKLLPQITTAQIVGVGKAGNQLQITTGKIMAVGKPVNIAQPGVIKINTGSIIGIGKKADLVEYTTGEIVAVGK